MCLTTNETEEPEPELRSVWVQTTRTCRKRIMFSVVLLNIPIDLTGNYHFKKNIWTLLTFGYEILIVWGISSCLLKVCKNVFQLKAFY